MRKLRRSLPRRAAVVAGTLSALAAVGVAGAGTVSASVDPGAQVAAKGHGQGHGRGLGNESGFIFGEDLGAAFGTKRPVLQLNVGAAAVTSLCGVLGGVRTHDTWVFTIGKGKLSEVRLTLTAPDGKPLSARTGDDGAILLRGSKAIIRTSPAGAKLSTAQATVKGKGTGFALAGACAGRKDAPAPAPKPPAPKPSPTYAPAPPAAEASPPGEAESADRGAEGVTAPGSQPGLPSASESPAPASPSADPSAGVAESPGASPSTGTGVAVADPPRVAAKSSALNWTVISLLVAAAILIAFGIAAALVLRTRRARTPGPAGPAGSGGDDTAILDML
jgi:hypothetical protein